VTTEDGRVLRKVDDTSPGRALNIRVSDGSVLARTEETQR
jgi:exonuclease VII large subunit